MTESNRKTQSPFLMGGLSTIGFLEAPKLSIDENGNTTLEMTLLSSFNLIPVWVQCAHEHLLNAYAAGQRLANEWNDDSELRKKLLMNELAPCLQVVITCGVILDALYGQLEPHAIISDDMKKKWHEKGTSRHSKICHVIRSLYKMNNSVGKGIKGNLKAVLQLRNKAIHPSSQIKEFATRPDIPVSVDWWFSAFRYSNAVKCWEATTQILCFLLGTETSVERINQIMKNTSDALLEMNLISTPEKAGKYGTSEHRKSDRSEDSPQLPRPEYQIKAVKGAAPEPEQQEFEATKPEQNKLPSVPAAAPPVEKQPWPKTLPERIVAIRDLIIGTKEAWSAEAVARSFVRGQVATALPVLESLTAVGVLFEYTSDDVRTWRAKG